MEDWENQWKMGTVSELRGRRVLLRTLRADDVAAVTRIRQEPEVARRWGSVRPNEIEGDVDRDNVFAIEVDKEIIGVVQYYEEDNPMYRHANLDIFLTSSRHGHGLGTEAMRLLARHLLEARGHHRLTIDPAADNEPAIRAYQRVGFRTVGFMREYERGLDGTWHDGLLMDMLKEDFREGDGS